jgi:hypothetical protein
VIICNDASRSDQSDDKGRAGGCFFLSRHDWLVFHQGMLGGAVSAIIIEDVFDTSFGGVRRGFHDSS